MRVQVDIAHPPRSRFTGGGSPRPDRVRARAPGPAVLYARELASALQDVGAPLDRADGTSKSSAPPQSGPVMLRLSGVSARRDRRPAGALSGGTQQKLNVA